MVFWCLGSTGLTFGFRLDFDQRPRSRRASRAARGVLHVRRSACAVKRNADIGLSAKSSPLKKQKSSSTSLRICHLPGIVGPDGRSSDFPPAPAAFPGRLSGPVAESLPRGVPIRGRDHSGGSVPESHRIPCHAPRGAVRPPDRLCAADSRGGGRVSRGLVLGCFGILVFGCLDIWKVMGPVCILHPRCPDTSPPKTKTPRHPNTQIPRYPNT